MILPETISVGEQSTSSSGTSSTKDPGWPIDAPVDTTGTPTKARGNNNQLATDQAYDGVHGSESSTEKTFKNFAFEDGQIERMAPPYQYVKEDKSLPKAMERA